MNEKFKRRLIGLIAVLALLFALSWLLPRTNNGGDADVPSTRVPLAVAGGADSNAAVQSRDPESVGQNRDETSADGAEPDPSPQQPVPPPPQGDFSEEKPAQSQAQPQTQISSTPSAPVQQHESPPSSGFSAAPPKVAASKSVAKAPSRPVEASKPAVIAKPAPTVTSKSQTSALPPPKPSLAPVPSNGVTPKSAAAVPATTSSLGGSASPKIWYVQIGSFSDQANAQTTLSLLNNAGYHAESTSVPGANGISLYRVRMGPFSSEAAAEEAQGKIAHQGYPKSRVTSEAGKAH